MQIVRSMQGMENAENRSSGLRYWYDFSIPARPEANLESKFIHGLFFSGQINGTTGYEEAAAGAAAGLERRRFSAEKGLGPGAFRAYLGVLVDDLCTWGQRTVPDVYSRAEYRLMLREDNADLRLTEMGRELGLVDDERWARFNEKLERIELDVSV